LYIFYFHYINYLHYIIVQAKPLHVSFRRNLDDQQSTLFKVLCVTVLKISLLHFFLAYVCSLFISVYGSWGSVESFSEGSALQCFLQYTGNIQ